MFCTCNALPISIMVLFEGFLWDLFNELHVFFKKDQVFVTQDEEGYVNNEHYQEDFKQLNNQDLY